MPREVEIKIKYWCSWFNSNATQLTDYLSSTHDDIMFSFINIPVKVNKGEKKPFEVYVENKLIYSNITPINNESGPILFSNSKWYGEPVAEHLERFKKVIHEI